MKKERNLQTLMNEMEGYCELLSAVDKVVMDRSVYDIFRMVRNDIKDDYKMNKGVFTFYYKLYRKRF